MKINNNTANQRLLAIVFGLLLPFVLLTVPTFGQNKAASIPAENHAAPETMSWNITDRTGPLLVASEIAYSSLDSRFTYPGNDFAFPLFQILYYDAERDCFALMVLPPKSAALQVIHLQRLPSANRYRSLNGPAFELENSDSIKVVTSANKTRFLFALVGDGEWRCVAIQDPYGNYLLIDYRPDGLIARVRDSFSRSVVLNYHKGRTLFITQTQGSAPGRDLN